MHGLPSEDATKLLIVINAHLTCFMAQKIGMADHTVNIRHYMHGTSNDCSINNQTLTDEQVDFISLTLPSSCVSLSFARTALTETGIGCIATNLLLRGNTVLSNLSSLSLYDTSLTDEGVRLLCQALVDGRNKKLQHLNISLNARITEAGAREIAQMLAVNEGLQRLDVSYTSIGRQGVYDLCLTLVAKRDLTLQYLDITCNLSLEERQNDNDLNGLLKKVGERLELINY